MKTQYLIVGLLLTLGIGMLGAPSVYSAANIALRKTDPAQLAAYRLQALDAHDFATALNKAIESGDYSLAQSLVELGDDQGTSISEEHRLSAYPSTADKLKRTILDGATGAVTGDFESPAGLAGAIASDLIGIGDARDVFVEGKAAIQGKEYDTVVLGLASAGIVLTGGTLLTAGATSPADTGVSVMKNAYKTGKVSQPLVRHIRRSTDGLVDVQLLRTQLSEFGNLRPSRARAIVRTAVDVEKLDDLAVLSKSVGRVSADADLGTAVLALRYAENGDDLASAAKLTSHFGKQSRAVITLLGRGAFVATDLILSVAMWMFSAALWILATVWIIYRTARLFLAPFRRQT